MNGASDAPTLDAAVIEALKSCHAALLGDHFVAGAVPGDCRSCDALLEAHAALAAIGIDVPTEP